MQAIKSAELNGESICNGKIVASGFYCKHFEKGCAEFHCKLPWHVNVRNGPCLILVHLCIIKLSTEKRFKQIGNGTSRRPAQVAKVQTLNCEFN